MAHTPGPWDIRIGGNFVTVRHEDIPLAEIQVDYPFAVTEIHVANANLIAAAPDLLQCLKDAICSVTGLEDWKKTAEEEAKYPEAPYYDWAVAILKAEGVKTDE